MAIDHQSTSIRVVGSSFVSLLPELRSIDRDKSYDMTWPGIELGSADFDGSAQGKGSTRSPRSPRKGVTSLRLSSVAKASCSFRLRFAHNHHVETPNVIVTCNVQVSELQAFVERVRSATAVENPNSESYSVSCASRGPLCY